ncbi:MAG: hypothetical protein LBU89_12480 [Fibromonadaceae bacterium]|jgi:hypothetical protein|nr:hypothetical protein [Fibromonadaceae bacterium]
MNTIIVVTLVLTLLNSGLVILALSRLNGLRKDLRTPVVKKFGSDSKRKLVDIPKISENFGKPQRDDKQQGRTNQQSSTQNRPKRQAQLRRPAVKAPDVFSNESVSPAFAPAPPRPVATETPAAEGRRPLPPRFNGNTAENPAPPAPPVHLAAGSGNDNDDLGMEFDRSKMAHGRRNVVAKPVIEDDAEENV